MCSFIKLVIRTFETNCFFAINNYIKKKNKVVNILMILNFDKIATKVVKSLNNKLFIKNIFLFTYKIMHPVHVRAKK